MKDPGDRPIKDPAARRANRKRLRAFKKTVGRNIERIRKAQGIPLRTLARRTGFSAVKLDYWEMGRMTIPLDAILRIAGVLKVPYERLLTMPEGGETVQEADPQARQADDTSDNAPKDIPEDTPDGAPDDTPGGMPEALHGIPLARFLAEEQVQQVRAMLVREREGGSYPKGDAVEAMAEPVSDVFDLSLLFSDLVNADVSFYRHGLAWLAASLQRDAERLYRLYHGRKPSYD